MAQQASLAKLLSTYLLSSHTLGFQYGCILPEPQVQELFHLRAYFCLLSLAGLFHSVELEHCGEAVPNLFIADTLSWGPNKPYSQTGLETGSLYVALTTQELII